jgi:Family of unknown function (DUF6459)
VTAPTIERPILARPFPSPTRLEEGRRPRVRRAPVLEPPYDDELGDGPPWPGAYGVELPFDEPAPRIFRQPPDFFDRQPTSRRRLPDPEPWAARLVQAALEMIAGRRPAAQLQEWTTPIVLAELVLASGHRHWALPGGSPPTVRSVHVSEPADGVAEVAAVVQRGERYFAVAARLEGLDGRWRCVKICLG